MEDDADHKVITMNLNRSKQGQNERSGLRSPGELASGRDFPPAQPAGGPADVDPDYQPPPKKSDPLPRPGDAYRAHARFLNLLNTDLRMIHFVDKDCWSEGFAYADLSRVRWEMSEDPAKGPVLVLRFGDTEVLIEGRRLEDLLYPISEGEMPWVWEQPAGTRPREEDAVVITSLRIRDVDRENAKR